MRLSANARSLRNTDEETACPPSLSPGTRTEHWTDKRALHARQLVEELSHDLRQPLTSMRMNLQSAVRLLESSTPSVAAALEAITDCLTVEEDVIRMLVSARQRFAALIEVGTPLALNDLVRDVVTAVIDAEPYWGQLLKHDLMEPSPLVDGESCRLRFALLTIARHALYAAKDECGWVSPLVFETRGTPSRAELRLGGVCPHCVRGAGMQSLVGLIRVRTRHIDGVITIDARETGATIIISLPIAQHALHSTSGGKYGD